MESLCSSATSEIVLAAPFIKAATLSRLLERVKANVRIDCCTRWIPEEIASGVTDLEVWEVLKGRANARMFLRANLHAKYYRADTKCLVGSANVTSSAFGWRPDFNLELLTSVEDGSLAAFERDMFEPAIQVTEELYQAVRALVKQMPRTIISREEIATSPDAAWMP